MTSVDDSILIITNRAEIDSLREEIDALKEQNALLTVQVQRLGEAIANAAIKAGIIDGSIELTGPQLLMLCDNLTALPQQVKSDAERYRYLRSHNAEQFDRLVEESLDDAIDEAISAQEEKA